MGTIARSFVENEYSTNRNTWTAEVSCNDCYVRSSSFDMKDMLQFKVKHALSSKPYVSILAGFCLVLNGVERNKIAYESSFQYYLAANTFYSPPRQEKSSPTIRTSDIFNTNNATERSVPVSLKNKLYVASDYLSFSLWSYGGGSTANEYHTDAELSWGEICNVILDAPPSCSYTQVSDISDKPVWTQGMSVARVTISDSAAQYGGDITNVKLIVGTNSASISGNGNIDVPILDSGTLTPQIVVTDSRGQTTSYTLNPIMVMAYQKPSIESIELERHVPLGEQDETQVYINATIKQTPISGNSMGVPEVLVGGNDISDEIVWYNEPTHETVYDSTTAASKKIYGVVNDSEVFATGSTYNFTLSISDAFNTSESKTEVLPTIFITMDFQAGGKEIAFGDKADDDITNHPNGLFRCNMDFIETGMIGEVKMWACEGIPNNWLLCDGSAFSANDYPVLAARLGDSWGQHSGDTYYLPNMCGRSPVGYDPDDTDTSETFGQVGAVGGARGAWSHNHSASQDAHSHYAGVYKVADRFGSGSRDAAGTYSGYGGAIYTDGRQPAVYVGNMPNVADTDNTLSADKANMPPYAVVKYIICAY